MPVNRKRMAVIGTDLLIVLSATWLAFTLRLGVPFRPEGSELLLFLAAPLIALPLLNLFGLYRTVIRFIGFKALWAIFNAVSLYILLWGAVVLFSGIDAVPRSVIPINWLACLLLIGGSRLVARWWLLDDYLPFEDDLSGTQKPIIIYGAGAAGLQLAAALMYNREMIPIAFIDDDESLQDHVINGFKVYPVDAIESLIREYEVKEILLALPSVSKSRRKQILRILEPLPLHVRTVPAVTELAQGKKRVDDIREVGVADLLGRDSVAPNQELLHTNIAGKVVLVTGAGGSIGSELCRQISRLGVKNLVLYEQGEYNLYALEKEFNGKNISCIPVLGSVLDSVRLKNICMQYGVQTIYHAAAYKHVPMVEKNPVMGIYNNIIGTWRTARVAIETGVDTFVLISSDKAVRPTNVMGATKRFSELILQSLNKNLKGLKPCFSTVRFGNVLDSSGSVVPLFREQIKKGGPVTVTHPDITRYFMTVSEASLLVIQAGAMGRGGDVFVLDMGQPVRIDDLAREMIRLSGLDVKEPDNPQGDIEIEYTGLRAGEKLYEELLIEDNAVGTAHPLIMRAEDRVLPWKRIEGYIRKFELAIENSNSTMTQAILLEVVEGYAPQSEIDVRTIEEQPASRIVNFPNR